MIVFKGALFMYSRIKFFNSIKFFILLGFIGLSLSCNLKVGDDVHPQTTGRLAKGTLDCLSDVEDQITSFIDGNISEKQVRETMACVRSALDLFDKMGRGKSNHGFEPKELSNFLNDMFLGESKITPELQTEFMTIKVLIVGGKDSFVTKDEFRKLSELVNFVENESLRLRPYMKLFRQEYKFDQKSPADLRFLDDAKAQLTRSFLNIAGLLRSSQSSYSMTSLRKLFFEARKFLRWDEHNPNGRNLDQWMSLVETYRQIALGDPENNSKDIEILPKQWVPLFGTFTEWYGLYLDYFYRIRGAELSKGAGLNTLINVTTRGLNLVDNSINIQKDSVMSFALLDRILEELYSLGLIPNYFRLEESLKPALRYIVTYMFRDLRFTMANSRTPGLQSFALSEMRKEFLMWADTQRELVRRYDFTNQSFHMSISTQCDSSIDSLDCLIERFKPFYQQGDNRLWIYSQSDTAKNPLKHQFDGLTRLNTLRILARLLIRGWAEDSTRAVLLQGITEQEAVKFYDTAKEIGQDLKFMDPRQYDVGSRFFREANLFTFTGNGIQDQISGTDASLLTVQESIEQLAIYSSSGITRDQIYEEAMSVCKEKESNQSGNKNITWKKDPVFGYEMIPRNCVVDYLNNNLGRVISNLPGFQNYLLKLNPIMRKSFINTALDLAKVPCGDLNYIELSEIATLGALMHYLEVVYTRFDLNSDGIVQAKEAMKGYSIFRGFLKNEMKRELKRDLPENQVKGVYTFLLSEGRIPDNLMDRLKMGYWDLRYFNDDPNQFETNDFSTPNFTFDRMNFLKVLSVLNETTIDDSNVCKVQ